MSDPETRGLLQEAADWRLLALLFECPRAGWREQVAALAREIADPDLRAAARRARTEAAEGPYHSIFGPGGPAPPREVSYRDSVQLGYLLSELRASYEAFCYRPVTEEPADHVSVEAGFVSYLRLKEAYALICGDREHAAVTREAADRFVADHLSVLAAPLARALDSCGVRYLALAGQALAGRAGAGHETPSNPLPILDSLLDDCGAGCAEV
jgi:TorA maturation chaperone TorD